MDDELYLGRGSMNLSLKSMRPTRGAAGKRDFTHTVYSARREGNVQSCAES